MAKREVLIYGAGMAGLIAAVDLSRHGYKVIMHDREKGYGGDAKYNPSVHATPIDVKCMSAYIDIDISSAFHPLLSSPVFIHDTRLEMQMDGKSCAVERGNRPSSLDTVLWNAAQKEDIEYEFNSPLTADKLKDLPQNSIVACGLTPEVYEMLDIPYVRTYSWCSRGESGFSNISFTWFDECITEYGYMTSINNYYFDMLFSVKPITPQALEKYRAFIRRNIGLEYDNWSYIPGGVPMARSDNPRLHQKGLIMCGTIAGFMDPFSWFGIVGALISGKISAMALYDPQTAQREFDRYTKNFKVAHFFKKHVYSRLKKHVTAIEKIVQSIGVSRIEAELVKSAEKNKDEPVSFPYLVTEQDVQNLARSGN